jgi:hypothetical protein
MVWHEQNRRQLLVDLIHVDVLIN